jgi:hypothetical protein
MSYLADVAGTRFYWAFVMRKPSRQLRYYHRRRLGLVDLKLTNIDPDELAHLLRGYSIPIWDSEPTTLAEGIKKLLLKLYNDKWPA